MDLLAAAYKWQEQKREAHLKNIKSFSKKIEKAVAEGKTQCEVGNLTKEQIQSFDFFKYDVRPISGNHVETDKICYAVSGWVHRADMLEQKARIELYGDRHWPAGTGERVNRLIHPDARTQCVDAIDALRYATQCLPKVKSHSELLGQYVGRGERLEHSIGFRYEHNHPHDAISSRSALEAAAEQIEGCFGEEVFSIKLPPINSLLGDELHKQIIDDLKDVYNVSD